MLALDDLPGLVLEAEERQPLLLELLHPGGELLEAGLVVVPLLLELQLLDQGVLDVDRGISWVVVVCDLRLLLEGLVHAEAEVEAAVGASGPSSEVVKGAGVPNLVECFLGFGLCVHL